jgi:hypothetical protein
MVVLSIGITICVAVIMLPLRYRSMWMVIGYYNAAHQAEDIIGYYLITVRRPPTNWDELRAAKVKMNHRGFTIEELQQVLDVDFKQMAHASTIRNTEEADRRIVRVRDRKYAPYEFEDSVNSRLRSQLQSVLR